MRGHKLPCPNTGDNPVPLEQTPLRTPWGDIVYLTAPQVRARYGGISDMTLWRWLADPKLSFPRPVIINQRRYFPTKRLDDFDQRQAAISTTAR